MILASCSSLFRQAAKLKINLKPNRWALTIAPDQPNTAPLCQQAVRVASSSFLGHFAAQSRMH